MKRIIILLLVLIPVVFAEEDILTSRHAVIVTNLSSEIKVHAEQNARLDYILADLFFFPRNDKQQTVQSMSTTPSASIFTDSVRYVWDQPIYPRYLYGLTATVRVANPGPTLKGKVPFPLTNLPSDAKKYLAATEHIDSSDHTIQELANRLAEGEDDLWVVVSKAALWTKQNIQYNLSTLTASVSQPASWVLENRQGVCDEMTSLFIALLRSLGVPARFVSGLSYTNSPLFPNNWGAHGWAEVYFPGNGWISFDPTFGEFGWVDAGHVKMYESADPGDSTSRFEWRGSNVKLTVAELNMTGVVKELGDGQEPYTQVAVSVDNDKVGFGSYNIVEATITNRNPYYYTTEVSLADVAELESMDALSQGIILKPGEQGKLYWRVKVKEDLDPDFVYSMPILVYTTQNISDTTWINASARWRRHTLESVNVETPKVYARQLTLECASKPFVYLSEQARAQCTLRNTGNVLLEDVRVCLAQQCNTVNIPIAQTTLVEFDLPVIKPALQDFTVTAKNPEISVQNTFTIDVRDEPDIELGDLSYPAMVRYDERFDVSMLLKKESYSEAQKVGVKLGWNDGQMVLTLPRLVIDQPITFELLGRELKQESNTFKVDVIWQDENGKTYSTTKSFVMKRAPLTLGQRFVAFFRSITGFVSSVFK